VCTRSNDWASGASRFTARAEAIHGDDGAASAPVGEGGGKKSGKKALFALGAAADLAYIAAA
jgi:hypothetical protein